MTSGNFGGDVTVKSKRIWEKPAIKIIPLNVARNLSHVNGDNDGTPNKS
jgi:hypothetical protein